MSILNEITGGKGFRGEEKEDRDDYHFNKNTNGGDRNDNNRDNRNNNGNRDNRNNNGNRDNNSNRDNRNNNGYQDNRNNNGNRDNNSNRDNRNNNGNRDNRDDRNNQSFFRHDTAKMFREKGKAHMYTTPVKIKDHLIEEGLATMIKDIKEAKKNKQQFPQYVVNAVYDVAFCVRLEQSVTKCIANGDIKKKDLILIWQPVMDFIAKLNMSQEMQIFGNQEVIDDMKAKYVAMLVEFNSKKYDKLKKNIEGITDKDARFIAAFSCGKSTDTVYNILKYLYLEVGKRGKFEDGMFSTENKSLIEIFKICYGKDCMEEIVLKLMLEPNIKATLKTEVQGEIWATLDEILRDELESLKPKRIKEIIDEYIKERINQERKFVITRRLGDRRTIHQDDYPKINAAFADVELENFTVKKYLRAQ
jgi:hypothetical protein